MRTKSHADWALRGPEMGVNVAELLCGLFATFFAPPLHNVLSAG
jgi:hypothetical protein